MPMRSITRGVKRRAQRGHAPGPRVLASAGARRKVAALERVTASLDGRPGQSRRCPGMAITETSSTSTSPLDIARALAPKIRARADEIEAGGQLPYDLVLDIAHAGLFKTGLSVGEGGLGAGIVTA